MLGFVVPSIRFCSTEDGKRLAYALDGDGPAIVFPAWWISHLEKDWEHGPFQEFFSALARHHLVVRYDRVGVGLSDRVRDPKDMTVDREAEHMGALIDHLGLDKCTLFGVSCGGPTAITYTERNPSRVRSLILHGSYLRGCSSAEPEVQEALVGLVRASWGVGSKTLASLFTPDHSPQELRRIAAMQRESANGETAAQLLMLGYSADVAAMVSGVTAPCLVTHRQRDGVIRFDAGRELAASLPDASFVPLDGTAHAPWEGDRAALLEQIFAFLGTDLSTTAADVSPAKNSNENALIRRGEVWTLSFEDAQALLKHSKGLADLATLLANPGEEIAAATLMHQAESVAAPVGSDDVLDDRARSEFRARVQAIDEGLEEARSFNDLGRIERLGQERDAILAELRVATGLGGRSRKLKDPAERARKAVSARIRESIQRIAEAHPAAGEHFAEAVRTGAFCCYEPKSGLNWQL
jgi:pimeloyl-ACP methyl ester carboxylesterase